MSPSLLYEAPFTDLAPTGPDGPFDATQLDRLGAMLTTWRRPRWRSNATAGPGACERRAIENLLR